MRRQPACCGRLAGAHACRVCTALLLCFCGPPGHCRPKWGRCCWPSANPMHASRSCGRAPLCPAGANSVLVRESSKAACCGRPAHTHAACALHCGCVSVVPPGTAGRNGAHAPLLLAQFSDRYVDSPPSKRPVLYKYIATQGSQHVRCWQRLPPWARRAALSLPAKECGCGETCDAATQGTVSTLTAGTRWCVVPRAPH